MIGGIVGTGIATAPPPDCVDPGFSNITLGLQSGVATVTAVINSGDPLNPTIAPGTTGIVCFTFSASTCSTCYICPVSL